jgi:hypothetical protein
VRYNQRIATALRLSLALVACSAVGVGASRQPIHVSALQRFLARGDEPAVEYRALRRLEAHNPKFNAGAWLVAWTEFDRAGGFRFQVVDEGGSTYVRRHVLHAALEGEQKMWNAREPQRASLTEENYLFEDDGVAAGGLATLGLKPRRKDVLLIEGSLYVHPDDGELRRIEGRLSKNPSVWTRRVDIVRGYERLAGVRVPVLFESTAHVLIAGRSTFRMTYEYETINGQRVGNPDPTHAAAH